MDDTRAIREVAESAGDRVLAELETATLHAFVAADGAVTTAPRFVLATDRRCWVVARTPDGRRFGWATGAVDAVGLDTGWTRDRLHVGPWRLPLRRGTRAEAQALVSAFAAGGGGGPDVEPPPGTPLPAVAAGRGATGVPAELATTGAEGPERWLLGLATSTTRPFNHHHGTLHDAPYRLLATNQRTLLVARAPWGETSIRTVDRLDVEVPTSGRPTLTVDGLALVAPTGSRAVVPVLLTIHRAPDPAGRWRAAAASALDEPDPRRAIALWGEARELGEDVRRFLVDVAAVAWAFDQGEVVTRAWAASEGLPDDVVAHVRAAENADRTLRRALGRQHLRWSEVHDGLGLRDLGPVARTEGLPWPAERYAEAVASGLAARGRFAEAASLWALVSDEPRRLAGLAVLREPIDPETGRATWREAARAHAEREAWGQAQAALRRAAGDDPQAEDHAQLARWALAEAVDPDDHWRAAVALDPSGRFTDDDYSLEEWRSLYAAAPEAAVEVRATALRALVAQAPSIARYEALAALQGGPLGRPAEAAATLERAAERADARAALGQPPETDDPTAEAPRFDRWVRIAELYARDGEPEKAVGALVEAVTGDFLDPTAYRRALDSQVAVAPALRRWWAHLRDVLGTTPPEPHPRWVHRLDDATLDALHPGGIGWLDRLRHSVEPSATPERSALTRGLERLTAEAWPRHHAKIEEVSQVLGMAVPEAYLYRGEGAWGVSAQPTHPPVLLVGITHLEPGERELDDDAFAFALAVEQSHLRCGHPILAMDQSVVGTSRSVYSAFGRYANAAESVFDVLTLVPGIDQIAKLQGLFRIGRRVFAARTALDKATSLASPLWERLVGRAADGTTGIGRENLQGAGLQVRMHADRVALLVTGDLHAAIRAILTASTRSAELLSPIAEDGLLSVLTTERMPADEALRITALIAFAAQLRPDLPEATPGGRRDT